MENLSAKDFRIGNFVKARTTDDTFNVVKEIGFSDNQRGYYLRLENVNHGVWLEYNGENLILGIPITEDWLVNLGFEKQVLSDNSAHYYTLELNDEKYCDLSICSGDKNVFIEATLFPYENFFRYKYVHELQNLFFAITGIELELKTDV